MKCLNALQTLQTVKKQSLFICCMYLYIKKNVQLTIFSVSIAITMGSLRVQVANENLNLLDDD